MEQQKDYSRRSSNRRQKERRENPHDFNSPEWIAVMQKHYELWPKRDNRKSDRRDADRRSAERRASLRNSTHTRSSRHSHTHDLSSILGHHEKQFIIDLFNEEINQ